VSDSSTGLSDELATSRGSDRFSSFVADLNVSTAAHNDAT